MPEDSALLAVLGDIRTRGAIGEASLTVAVAHAERFVDALPPGAYSLADLGSGGGLPGLVIAMRRPDISVMLVERRRSRSDLLQKAVRALGVTDHVEVFAGDVAALARIRPNSFDAVTARSFAAPQVTSRWAAELLAPGGTLVVSEPPQESSGRWPTAMLGSVGLVESDRAAGRPGGGVRVFRKLPST
ncbi:MAG: class I SAM-dependent methyltransferase [Actinobacteria bacterium]|nr:class I SAM-dependent methyltransferase [Actinomycetota bacterium]